MGWDELNYGLEHTVTLWFRFGTHGSNGISHTGVRVGTLCSMDWNTM